LHPLGSREEEGRRSETSRPKVTHSWWSQNKLRRDRTGEGAEKRLPEKDE
jgi:hypothetical protein